MENMQTSGATEETSKLAALAKCAHPGCTCTVDDGERFCSDYCAQEASASKHDEDHACECGHAECDHAKVVPILDGALVN